jgi:hypothetical protein
MPVPTSDLHNISPVVSIGCRTQPKRLLDVGCGFGKYGVLMREYLDVAQERLVPESWQTEIIGIEGHEPYRNPIHDFVYNKVHYGDATEVLPKLGRFDLIMVCDVIEHFEKEAARRFAAAALDQSRYLLISTPREPSAQGDICGNAYERHRCVFDQKDFPEGVYLQTVGAVDCLIFVASREPFPANLFVLTEPADHLYIRMRYHWGALGFPVAVALRGLNRLIGKK